MELTSIYKVVSSHSTNSGINARIAFNKDHVVFGGHFPGNPIVPGVVQVQILKDLLENTLHKKVFLNRVKSIKFLNVINPVETNNVHFEITIEHNSEIGIKVKCIVKTENQIYMKFSGNALIEP
jgi:3-hydroxyacyl-[acyl-carrier-protein] dehydratase